MKTVFNCLLAAVFVAVCLAAPASATEVQRVISPGGIEAWLVEEHNIPILSLRASWRGGAAFDKAGREGTANFELRVDGTRHLQFTVNTVVFALTQEGGVTQQLMSGTR